MRNSGSSTHGYGLVHSSGHKRPIINNEIDTTKYAALRDSQTSNPNGAAKEKKLGGALVAFLYNMLIPVSK